MIVQGKTAKTVDVDKSEQPKNGTPVCATLARRNPIPQVTADVFNIENYSKSE